MDKIDPVGDDERWVRHLLTPAEISGSDSGSSLNPKIFENLFNRSKSSPKAISGRLLGIAHGKIRLSAELTVAKYPNNQWKFHGVLHGLVGEITRLTSTATCKVEHAPLPADDAHANYVSTNLMFDGDMLTPEIVIALWTKFQLVREDSDEFKALDA